MKVNWLKFISVVFLFCMLLSCRKDEDFENERLSEASYYNHSRNCITTTVFKYENGRVTSYSSLHYDYNYHDTVDVQNTEIEYSGDSVMLSTSRIWPYTEILYKIVRHYDEGRLIKDIKYLYRNGGFKYFKEVAYEYQNRELLRRITELKIDSVFRHENKLTEIKTYNRSGADNIISMKETFKYDGDRISQLSDSIFLHYQGIYHPYGEPVAYLYLPNGLLHKWSYQEFEYNSFGKVMKIIFNPGHTEDYVTYKYEDGKGNAVQLFNDPFEQILGLPHDPGFGWQ